MNVQCETCETVYRVDPDKVPESGVRARCTVCSGIIVLASSPDIGSPQRQGQVEPARAPSAEQVAVALGDAFIPVPPETQSAAHPARPVAPAQPIAHPPPEPAPVTPPAGPVAAQPPAAYQPAAPAPPVAPPAEPVAPQQPAMQPPLEPAPPAEPPPEPPVPPLVREEPVPWGPALDQPEPDGFVEFGRHEPAPAAEAPSLPEPETLSTPAAPAGPASLEPAVPAFEAPATPFEPAPPRDEPAAPAPEAPPPTPEPPPSDMEPQIIGEAISPGGPSRETPPPVFKDLPETYLEDDSTVAPAAPEISPFAQQPAPLESQEPPPPEPSTAPPTAEPATPPWVDAVSAHLDAPAEPPEPPQPRSSQPVAIPDSEVPFDAPGVTPEVAPPVSSTPEPPPATGGPDIQLFEADTSSLQPEKPTSPAGEARLRLSRPFSVPGAPASQPAPAPAQREPVRPTAPVFRPTPGRPVQEPPAPPSTPTAPTPQRPVNPFLSKDPAQRARRLARALISDMIVYQPEKRQKAIREGNLKEAFDEEIKKSWEEFVEQVGDDTANSTTHFNDALNEILADGQQIF